MNEKTTELLEKYDLSVNKINRARGGFVCFTDKGPKLFREYRGNEKHLDIEMWILDRIRDSGLCKADYIIKNLDGKILTKSDDGTGYILKEWYNSHECSIWDKSELYSSCRMMATVHEILSGYKSKDGTMFELYPCRLDDEFVRHTFELKRARTFIRNKNRKSEFELKILACFERFYEKAVAATEKMSECKYDEQRGCAYEKQSICHGSFNYHNIVFDDREAVPVNFERAVVDVQITDFYDFLRKVMEKHNWDVELGNRMISEYDKVRNISGEEHRILKVMLMYPEKFWKIVNQYYNGNKSWIPDKNMGKLDVVLNQEDRKEKFVAGI